MQSDLASFAERFTADDVEKAGRLLKRESLTVPPEVIEFMTEAAVQKLTAK